MSISKLLSTVFGILMLASVAGCDQADGPFEKAGEEVDNTLESAGDKMEEVGDEIKDATN
ncbi:hypothetical protein [Motiliproteus sp. MSK22-1]|uniref:hypothetical protein n=1 Tax=Motiliproteus sp. MSK22-1 TaxID=1897630 RepID=UPI00097755AF|nr:hypothetical protein [Motiliproteus sp. MSK22-1]OMH33626.1 hypothetical protein BGP75_11435 [Motiliproteus sp. MSK22-1]